MATIEHRENSYRVMIRKKGVEPIYRSFKTKEDAELFVAWKEDILDQMSAFNPAPKNLITLNVALELKVIQLKEKNAHPKSIGDISVLKIYFKKFLDLPLIEISYNDYLQIFNEILEMKVSHGGNVKKQVGTKTPSIGTIRSRFNLLQSVYSNIIESGIDVENHPTKILKYIKTLGET